MPERRIGERDGIMKETDQRTVQGLLDFIRKSPTAFQAVGTAAEMLEAAGFCRLEEGKTWSLAAGGKYYLTRNQSSVLAFALPAGDARQLLLSASHTDSPMFKLKSDYNAPAFATYVRFDTEVYGGTILSSWMDRPLSLAGRAVVRRGEAYRAELFDIGRDLMVIPNVAIHMNRAVNSGYAFNPAVDMLPLFSMAEGSPALSALLAEQLGCAEDAIVGMDAFVYNRMPGSVWGAANEFFSAPRIDNLMCLYGTLRGFLGADAREDSLNLWFSADNEETGSATKQGAGSVLLSDTLDRICEAMGWDRHCLLANGFMVSADNGHARHPNHPELSDPKNSPRLGGGVVVKTNAAQHYTTDGPSAALFGELCRMAGVPVQQFANRSDQPGGSTLGSISNTKVPLMTVDIGMAQLAMHSAYETAGCADCDHLERAMTAFYGMTLRCEADGQWRMTGTRT